jgi:hypothetical protein
MFAASTAKSFQMSDSSAKWRALIPVRSTIHSSEVSKPLCQAQPQGRHSSIGVVAGKSPVPVIWEKHSRFGFDFEGLGVFACWGNGSAGGAWMALINGLRLSNLKHQHPTSVSAAREFSKWCSVCNTFSYLPSRSFRAALISAIQCPPEGNASAEL